MDLLVKDNENPAGQFCYDGIEVGRIYGYSKECEKAKVKLYTMTQQYNKCVNQLGCEESFTNSKTLFWASVISSFIIGFTVGSHNKQGLKMSTTLSYGYVKPVSGDKGTAGFFTPMANNIQLLNDHTHNGVDSASLTAQALVGVPQNILAANWVSTTPIGFYRQLVTIPAGFDYDLVGITFRLSTGEYITPTVERVSDTTYYVYTIDNSLTFVAVYGG